MRFQWRDEEIHTYAEWRQRIAPKDDQPLRSAPTLAAAWSGPLDLLSALSEQPALRDLEIERVSIEAQTHFDAFGGPRNHDLLIQGQGHSGKVLVAVEAKAGEPFGQTVSEYRTAATRKREAGESTNSPERLDQLLENFGLKQAEPAEVDGLRYQLLAALAGTLVAAEDVQADHAVLMVHDFITDDRLPHGGEDLRRFARMVCSADLPEEHVLWCTEVDVARDNHYGFGGHTYLAHAESDLRSPLARSD